jgi:hypothetical protein
LYEDVGGFHLSVSICNRLCHAKNSKFSSTYDAFVNHCVVLNHLL